MWRHLVWAQSLWAQMCVGTNVVARTTRSASLPISNYILNIIINTYLTQHDHFSVTLIHFFIYFPCVYRIKSICPFSCMSKIVSMETVAPLEVIIIFVYIITNKYTKQVSYLYYFSMHYTWRFSKIMEKSWLPVSLWYLGYLKVFLDSHILIYNSDIQTSKVNQRFIWSYSQLNTKFNLGFSRKP